MHKKIVKFTLIFFAIGILFFTISPILFDKKEIVSTLSKKIKNDLNLDIKFDENLKISFFPFPELKIRDLSYIDDVKGIDFKIDEVEVTSTWKSLFKLEPNINYVKLRSPIFKFKKDKFSSRYKVLVKNRLTDEISNVKGYLNKFKNLEIKDGEVKFYIDRKLHQINNLDLIITNSVETKLKADFNYVNYKSFFKLSSKTNNFIDLDYNLNQLFDNKNELFGSGKVKLLNNEIIVKGDFKSSKLSILEISKIISQVKVKKNDRLYLVDSKFPDLKFNINIEIDELVADKIIFKKTTSNIFSNNKNIKFNEFRTKYKDSVINAQANYSYLKKQAKGKVSIYDFQIDKDLIGSPEFNIKDTTFDCDINFVFNNKKNQKIFNNLFASGDCITPGATLVGIDINKIAKQVDNLETFQDFFNLFNKKGMNGQTKIDSIDFSFKLKESIFSIINLTALQNNFKVSTSGTYSIYKDNLSLQNEILIKTNKYKNLPSFKVLVNGKSKDYKVSYDFEDIKSEVLTNGINSILKKKNKIVIDPKTFKNLIDKNSKEFKPDKLIDLFLN